MDSKHNIRYDVECLQSEKWVEVKHVQLRKVVNILGFDLEVDHHGLVLCSKDREVVVHYAKDPGSLKGKVVVESLAGFSGKTSVTTPRYNTIAPNKLPVAEVAERALSRVGEENYDVLQNNSEHFVTSALYGTAKSWQAELLTLMNPLLFSVNLESIQSIVAM